MARRLRYVSKKKNLPPGSATYVGDRKEAPTPCIRVLELLDGALGEFAAHDVSELKDRLNPDARYWIRMIGIHDSARVSELGKFFNLHPLHIEDVLNTEHQPKIEELNEWVFAILKLFKIDSKGSEVHTEHFSLILGGRYVISFQESENTVFQSVMERLTRTRLKDVRFNEDYVFYTLLDTVIDSYFAFLEMIGSRIENVETALYERMDEKASREINSVSVQLIDLKRIVRPLRDPLRAMTRAEYGLIDAPLKAYFRDLYDHINFVSDHLESYRDEINALYNRYMMLQSTRANDVNKTLTIFATIFIPLTFLTGVYGMNFQYMPELAERYAYPAFWLIVVTITTSMLFVFKRKGWW